MSAQDPDVREPTIRLRLLLALMRALAGRRGRAQVAWHGAGFDYVLTVTRGGVAHVDLDSDPTALDRAELVDMVRSALR